MASCAHKGHVGLSMSAESNPGHSLQYKAELPPFKGKNAHYKKTLHAKGTHVPEGQEQHMLLGAHACTAAYFWR